MTGSEIPGAGRKKALTILKTMQERTGEAPGPVRYVLAIGTALAVVALAFAYFVNS